LLSYKTKVKDLEKKELGNYYNKMAFSFGIIALATNMAFHWYLALSK
jgi:hypothetical protein